MDADAPRLDLQALLSATEASAYTGKTVQCIVNWRNRGLLAVARDAKGREIRDSRGRPKYRLIAVARADALAEQRGEKARGLRKQRQAA